MLDRETIKKWMRENSGTILYDSMNPGVFSGYVSFTPGRAALALTNNKRNRPLGVKKQLPLLRNVIGDGLWDDNVSKINFEYDGTLSDGQHRLEAAYREGRTIRCIVTWGVRKEAQTLVDRRGNRTLADDIAIDGGKNPSHLAAMTRILYMKSVGYEPKTLLNGGSTRSTIPDVVFFSYYLGHKDEVSEKSKMVRRIIGSVRDLDINGSIMNVLVTEFDAISPSDAATFWKRLSNGIAVMENDPIIALRKRLTDNARANVNKMPVTIIAALLIKAWNCFEKGEQVKLLKYTAGGANPEPFPDIYNPYSDDMEGNV